MKLLIKLLAFQTIDVRSTSEQGKCKRTRRATNFHTYTEGNPTRVIGHPLGLQYIRLFLFTWKESFRALTAVNRIATVKRPWNTLFHATSLLYVSSYFKFQYFTGIFLKPNGLNLISNWTWYYIDTFFNVLRYLILKHKIL